MSETSYPPEFVTNLEMQWGIGFLSPGGSEEVREILLDIDVQDKTMLDIGCGIGGPDIVIARELSPKCIVGVDVEPYLIEKGRQNIAAENLGGVVELMLIKAGPLPFDDQSFDVVFSKDSLIHIEDKCALYKDVLRVLKPGGLFAASDWLRSDNADELVGYNEWRALTAHSFSMQTTEQTVAEMRGAGLQDVKIRDRSKWYADTAAQEVEMMKSADWKGQFISAFGEDNYPKKLALRIANARAAECGGLKPTHLFGRRP